MFYASNLRDCVSLRRNWIFTYVVNCWEKAYKAKNVKNGNEVTYFGCEYEKFWDWEIIWDLEGK